MQNYFKKNLLALLVIFLLFFSHSIFGFVKYDSEYQWKTIETPHFIYHYHDGLESLAKDLADYGEVMHSDISDYFSWYPKEKTHVIISDQQDFPNGFATVRLYNRIEIFATPPSSINSLEDFHDWKKIVFKHEYVHIVQLDKAEDFPLHMRGIVGRLPWPFLFPGQYMPNWIQEGIATYIETDKLLGVGRGQSSYYRGLMRNELINGFKSLNTINQIPSDWPGGTSSYLYGVYFFIFIQEKYGDLAIQDFFSLYSSIPVPFFLNYTASRTIGVDFSTLWEQFEIYLQKGLLKEHKVASADDIESKQLSHSGYYSGFSRTTVDGKLIFISNDAKQKSKLVEYDPSTNLSKVVYEISPQTISNFSRFDYHPNNGVLLAITDAVNNVRYPNDLYILDKNYVKLDKITNDARYIYATWAKDGSYIAAVQVNNGQHKLQLLNLDGTVYETLAIPGEDVLIGPLDWSPINNSIIASIFRPGIGWNLELFDVDNKHWTAVTENNFIESDPQFNADGSKILYAAEYNDLYNIYEYDLNTDSIVQLTNSNTVAFQPSYGIENDTIYYSQLGKGGFNLFQQQRKIFQKTKVSTSNNSILSNTESNSFDTYKSDDYTGFPYMGPVWWFPIIRSVNEHNSFGFETGSNDPLFWHNYYGRFDYDFAANNPRWLVSYVYKRFKPNFLLTSQRETFYDANDFIQHQTQYLAGFLYPITKNAIRINSKLAYQYTDIDIEHETLTSIHETRKAEVIILSASADTRTFRPRSYMAYDGLFASTSIENANPEKDIKRSTRVVMKGKYASPMIWDNLIEFNALAVIAGDLGDPVYLGGKFIESEDTVFTQDSYTLEGYKLDTFTGTNLQKLQINWNYLIAEPQSGIMAPPIGLSRIILKLYGIAARVGSFDSISEEKWNRSIGSEIQIRANFGYRHWPFLLTAGIAKGLDELGETTPYYEFKLQF